MSFPLFDANADASVQTFPLGGHKVHQIVGNNASASATVYLQIFDTATPTVGTTTPVLSLPLEPGVFGFHFGDQGVSISTGAMSYAVTQTPTGLAAPAATVVLNFVYS